MPIASHGARLDNVQVLRGLAALDVVVAHLPLFRHPTWGVDMFFIISGFIMCFVTARSSEHFFLKRLLRVVPLYWFGTFFVYGIALTFPSLLKNTSSDPWELLMSLAFIPFRKGDTVQPVLFLGWTLNFEMFFYLVFALSMAINHRLRGWICSLAMVGAVIAGMLIETDSVIVRFYTNPIVLEFALGIGCYGIFRLITDREIRTGESFPLGVVLATAALLLCLWLVLWQALGIDTRPVVYGLPCTAVFLLILQLFRNLPMPRLLVSLGDASYSLYLFHPYLIILFRKMFPSMSIPSLSGYVVSLIAVAICCLMALLCYRIFEAPLTAWLRRRIIGGSAAKPTAQAGAP